MVLTQSEALRLLAYMTLPMGWGYRKYATTDGDPHYRFEELLRPDGWTLAGAFV